MAPVDDPYCTQLMEDVIYNDGHVPAYDPVETQSQDGRAEFVADEEADGRADYDHGDSGMKTMTSIAKVMVMKTKAMTLILVAFQSLEAFKARHNDKPFTLTHCWTIINNFPKFKDQYRELQRKRGKKTTKFTGGGDGEALKRPRGKTNSKDMRDEKKQQSKDDQMKQQLELQRKKLEMEEAAKKRKIDLEEASRQRQLDIEAANIEARKRQLDIKAANAATKAKDVALAIMSLDLTKMSKKTRSWFEARQKEMFDVDGLN
ncbi:Serine/threonine-protein kinase mph1 [Hordeum vulgare]|nr:Serine/threonine-protein kinase mph1 [Hordeum vulgare]